MIVGYGGCSFQGLVLVVWWCGFWVKLVLFVGGLLFFDGVCNEDKKVVMCLVYEDFCEELDVLGVEQKCLVRFDILCQLVRGGQLLVLISSYCLICFKVLYWVLVIYYDEDFVYFYDFDVDYSQYCQLLDCQYILVSYVEFDKMSCFGCSKLCVVVILFNLE